MSKGDELPAITTIKNMKEELDKLRQQNEIYKTALEGIKLETGGYAYEFKRFTDEGIDIPSYAFEQVCGRMREIAREALKVGKDE